MDTERNVGLKSRTLCSLLLLSGAYYGGGNLQVVVLGRLWWVVCSTGEVAASWNIWRPIFRQMLMHRPRGIVTFALSRTIAVMLIASSLPASAVPNLLSDPPIERAPLTPLADSAGPCIPVSRG